MFPIDKGKKSRSWVFACRERFKRTFCNAKLDLFCRQRIRFVFFGKAQSMKENPGNGEQ